MSSPVASATSRDTGSQELHIPLTAFEEERIPHAPKLCLVSRQCNRHIELQIYSGGSDTEPVARPD